MRRMWKRLFALALCLMMTASICQLPAGNVQAKEDKKLLNAKANLNLPMEEISAGLLLQLIEKLGEDIDLENLSRYKEAINALEKMSSEERQELYELLREKLKTVEGMDELVRIIVSIKDITNPDENSLIKKAAEAYDKLSEEEKNELLTRVNDKLDKLEAVVKLFKKLDSADDETVEKARAAYEDLASDLKLFITKERLTALIEAEETIIKSIISKIGATVSDDDLSLVKDMKEIYEKWTAGQKEDIDSALIKKITNLISVEKVIELIDQAEASDTSTVEEAKKAFEALSAEAQDLIDEDIVEDLKEVIEDSDLEPEEKKFANTLTVKGKTVKVKAETLKKKAIILKCKKILKVSDAKGSLSYKLIKANKAKYKKYFKLGTKTGNIKLKKKLKKGTYKIKIRVTAAGDSSYEAGSKDAIVKFKVK